MRPLYVTQKQRDEINAVMEFVARELEMFPVTKTAISTYTHDLYKEPEHINCIAIAKVICRTAQFMLFDEYTIGNAKIQNMLRIASRASVPAYLIVKWTDNVIGFLNLHRVPYYVRSGGRTDRNDPADKEPMAVFQREHFYTLQYEPIKQLGLRI